MAPKALTKALIKKKELIFGLLFLISLTLLGYQKYWGNVWYLQDDYFTVDLGGTDSIWGAGEKMTTWLYRGQQRYQPVRFLLFSLATHLVPEEYSFFYNFGLHLVNVVLLFLLIRAFRVNNYLAFITSVVFSVYGVFRMIESPSAMIGGSGLNAFFIFLTLLYLKWSLESSSTSRKYTLLTLSYLSYLGLVFSYEVAFPMFATIVFFQLVVFNAIIQGQSVFSNPKKLWVLIPYFGALGAYYLLFCRQPTPYEGAHITISLAIFTRFLSYSKALLEPFTRFKFFLWPEIVIGLIIYYGGIYLIRRQAGTDDNPDAPLHPPRNPISLFLFGVVWYLSSVLLFILNNWISPTAVMHHHLYLMTPGVAMIICGLIFYFDYIFFSRWKNIFQWFLIYAVFPLFIINSMNFNLNYGSNSSEKTRVLFNVKKQIQDYIPDINDVDALLLINFLKPQNLHYYQISHLNGALLHWFNFKKYIESGDNVLSVKDGQITFQGPLSYYDHILHSKTLIVSNKKVEMLYYDSDQKKLLPYGNHIDFDKRINLHQTRQVRISEELKPESSALEAILRNSGTSQFLTLSFHPSTDPLAIVNPMVMGVNEMPVNEAYVSREAIYIDVSRFVANSKYLFLYLDWPEKPGFWQNLKNIRFTNSIEGVKRVLPQSAKFDFLKDPFHYRIENSIRFDDKGPVEFINWYDAEPTHRWAKGGSGSLAVRFGNLNSGVKQYVLVLKGFTFYKQNVEVRLNNILISTFSNDGSKQIWKIPFEAKLLKTNAVNTIEFRIPGARKPGGQDERTLGFAFQELLLTSKSKER